MKYRNSGWMDKICESSNRSNFCLVWTTEVFIKVFHERPYIITAAHVPGYALLKELASHPVIVYNVDKNIKDLPEGFNKAV